MLATFVDRGGRLIVDGLSAYYDEYAHCTMQTGFLLADLLGGSVRDVLHVADDFLVGTDLGDVHAHLWRGEIEPSGGTPMGGGRGTTLALRNRHGAGETIWVPSCLGLGAWVAG
ncbi:MAG: beta-galactosidase, partial [Oceanicaulis sp.]